MNHMNNTEEIKIEVQNILENDFGFSKEDFSKELSFDSITFVTLIIRLEEVFNITIPDDMILMENFRSIENVVKIITDMKK